MADPESPAAIKNRGWSVTFAGMGINLALGILYTWSVISKGVPAEWDWCETDKSLPYMFACLVFALVMVPAGRMQDKMGPRLVATIGGLLVGLGMIFASRNSSPLGYLVGFGILAGAGIGFGYASATPPAVKWFPSTKTGLIAGLVVSGFGMASLYAAPLTQWLIAAYSIQTAVLILGIAFLIVVVGLAQLLEPPPPGFSTVKQTSPAAAAISTTALQKENFEAGEMLKTPQFYLMWFMYACGAGAGLMIISKLAAIADKQLGIHLGYVLVATLAAGNGGGRIVAGMLSDRIGRKATLFLCFVMQAVWIMLLSMSKEGSVLATVPMMAILSALIGANYGANLALFPALTKDYFGLKNFGINYGLVFTSWGVGGFMLAWLAGKMFDLYETFTIAYYGASILLVLAAIMVFALKPPFRKHE